MVTPWGNMVMAAVETSGYALQHASARLQGSHLQRDDLHYQHI